MDDVSERVNDFAKAPCDLVKLYSGLLGTGMLTHRLICKNMERVKNISQARLETKFKDHAHRW